jgi:hypothetical protein
MYEFVQAAGMGVVGLLAYVAVLAAGLYMISGEIRQ